MAKIYLPTEYVNKDCKVINNDYIRVYTNNDYTSWVDIYPHNDYALKQGSSNYGSNTVLCDTLNTYTDDVYYRVDFPYILIMLFIMLIICLYFPYRIISRILGKWGKL